MAKVKKPEIEPEKDNPYKAMGFLCGLEIHQRLSTKEKLFCSCATNVLEKSSKPIASISRRQRAVAGELGAVDKSAEFEELRNRSFLYNIFEMNTCLVDVDEEPPHELNIDALDIALSLGASMGMRIVDEIQPMRKGVVDGSDPSAFQRTMLVGLDGSIIVGEHKINIPLMSLEEESSGIVSNSGTNVVYNTDRLAIPLIEIDTDANIPDPKTAKDVALYIGTLLRLTGRVQRGIGSIRQDVNMSIRDGARVEIKGVQELNFIDKFIENEITRQQKLIEIKKGLSRTAARVDAETNLTPLFIHTNVEIIKHHIKEGVVFGFALRGFKGFLGTEINPNRRLGTEISDYAKMAGVHGIIHSDEDLGKYGFSSGEISGIKKQLKLSDKDAFIIIAGSADEVAKASKLAVWRAEYALKGVPKETRMALDNESHTSRFMRPLPTGSRMYPETDVRPILITEKIRYAAAESAPNAEKERKYLQSKINNASIIDQLILSTRLQLFKAIIEKTGADPEFVANILVQRLTELRRNGIDVDSIEDKRMIELFGMYANEMITKQAVQEAIVIISKDKDDLKTILKKGDLLRLKGAELRALVSKMSTESKGASKDELRNRIMSKYRLNVDGAELNSLLK